MYLRRLPGRDKNKDRQSCGTGGIDNESDFLLPPLILPEISTICSFRGANDCSSIVIQWTDCFNHHLSIHDNFMLVCHFLRVKIHLITELHLTLLFEILALHSVGLT